MISVSGVSKNYGDIKAVDNISFSIERGGITGLLGPNGAGKTTTLRMLTCYLKPDSGTIRIGEFDSAEDSLGIRKLIGYLPESAPLYGDMFVSDYMEYIARMRGIDSGERIDTMAGLCGITEVMHKNINELSKGYKQRVGLAQAMIHDPEILVLDEPTSGLDPNQIIEIRNLIREIGKEKTVILSTHILSEVEASCDRVIIINRGAIVADDSTVNLKSLLSGTKSVAVKIKGAPYAEFEKALKSLDGVARVDKAGSSGLMGAVVSCPENVDIEPAISRLVADNGWSLYELKREQASLENVFRELTLGGTDEQD